MKSPASTQRAALVLALTTFLACSAPSRMVSPSPAAETGSNTKESCTSRAWYILRQDDSWIYLNSVSRRLAKASLPKYRTQTVWTGVPGGGSVSLRLDTEGEVTGEIIVGLFTDAAWSYPPVQVRSFSGPGDYVITGVPPGRYHIAALVVSGDQPSAAGVEREYPVPIEVTSAGPARAHLLVSTAFANAALPDCGLSTPLEWDTSGMEQSRLIKVRTVEASGAPIPFCGVTFEDRGQETGAIDMALSDEDGLACCDKIYGTFSLSVRRYELLPDLLGQRSFWQRVDGLWSLRDGNRINDVVNVGIPPFPTGPGGVTGTVRDQFGNPLKEYFLTLYHIEKGRTFYVRVPVTNDDGLFEVGALVPGEYQVMVRSFDYSAYDWNFRMAQFVIPDECEEPIECNIMVEAKKLQYGRALFEDGSPVHPGYWKVRLTDSQWESEMAWSTETNGNLRVALTAKQRQDILKNQQGMVEIGWYKQLPGGTWWSVPLGEIHIDKLSGDKDNPTLVVFPKPEESAQKDAGAGPDAPEGF